MTCGSVIFTSQTAESRRISRVKGGPAGAAVGKKKKKRLHKVFCGTPLASPPALSERCNSPFGAAIYTSVRFVTGHISRRLSGGKNIRSEERMRIYCCHIIQLLIGHLCLFKNREPLDLEAVSPLIVKNLSPSAVAPDSKPFRITTTWINDSLHRHDEY